MASGCIIDIEITRSEFDKIQNCCNVTLSEFNQFYISEESLAHILAEVKEFPKDIGERCYSKYTNTKNFENHLLLGFQFIVKENTIPMEENNGNTNRN